MLEGKREIGVGDRRLYDLCKALVFTTGSFVAMYIYICMYTKLPIYNASMNWSLACDCLGLFLDYVYALVVFAKVTTHLC